MTAAARGIGRVIAVELAANGADIAAIDICGFVSPASDTAPATPEDLAETVRQVQATGRRALAIEADIRNIGALREAIAETQPNPPAHPTPEQVWDARKVQVPLKVGWLRSEDVSPAAVFLASDAAAMVTGAEYEVTGGDSAHNV